MSISPVMQTNCKHSQSLSGTSTVAAYGADGGGGMGPLRRGDERRFLVDVAIDRRCNLRQSPTGDAISDRRCNLRQEMQSPTADAISALRQEMHSPTLSDRRVTKRATRIRSYCGRAPDGEVARGTCSLSLRGAEDGKGWALHRVASAEDGKERTLHCVAPGPAVTRETWRTRQRREHTMPYVALCRAQSGLGPICTSEVMRQVHAAARVSDVASILRTPTRPR